MLELILIVKMIWLCIYLKSTNIFMYLWMIKMLMLHH